MKKITLFLTAIMFVFLSSCTTDEPSENSVTVRPENPFVAQAIKDIESEFGRSNNKSTMVDLSEEDLVYDQVQDLSIGETRLLIFQQKGKRYVISYNSEGETVSLNSLENLNGNKSRTVFVGRDGSHIEYVFDFSSLSNKESCVGGHYRKMMEVIQSDGDLDILCWMTGCEAAVLVAAAAHCLGSH